MLGMVSLTCTDDMTHGSCIHFFTVTDGMTQGVVTIDK